MADRAQPLSARSGLCAAAFVAVLIFGTLASVALQAEGGRGLSPADWAALRFTLIQAGLSTLLSVALAVPVARALARRRFAGRRVLIAILGAPFILPVIVAILGLLAVFGRAGWISTVLGMVGFPPLQIYGLHGVVLAHVFFNLPLATRFLLQGWQEIPAERFRMAAQLDFDRIAMLRWIEWPMLRAVLPGIMAVIFAICLTSFAVALTLGGGPRATTVELAIYQAFRFDFDLGRAAFLAVIQLILTGAAALAALRVTRTGGFGTGLDRAIQRWDGGGTVALVIDMLWIGCAALFLLLPLTAVILSGLSGMADLPLIVIRSALTSILIATISTGLMLLLALPMAAAVAVSRVSGKMVELAGILGLAASPLVIGTGLFILIYPLTDPLCFGLTCNSNSQCCDGFAICPSDFDPARERDRHRTGPSVADAGHGGLAVHLAGSAAPDAPADRICGGANRGFVHGGFGGNHPLCRSGYGDTAIADLPVDGVLSNRCRSSGRAYTTHTVNGCILAVG